MKLINKFLNSLFPGICIICGKNNTNYLCPKCFILIKNELKYIIRNQHQEEVDLKEFKHYYLR